MNYTVKQIKNVTTHGVSRHPMYNTWNLIKQRCYNKNNSSYDRYGAKGITMQEDWIDNPIKFIEDIENKLGKKTSPEYSLDRIDNDKGYYIDNLRWATSYEQGINRKSTGTNTDLLYIHKKEDGRYTCEIRRNWQRRRAKLKCTLEEITALRDQWLKEYEENKEKWVEDTLNKTYDRGFGSQ